MWVSTISAVINFLLVNINTEVEILVTSVLIILLISLSLLSILLVPES